MGGRCGGVYYEGTVGNNNPAVRKYGEKLSVMTLDGSVVKQSKIDET